MHKDLGFHTRRHSLCFLPPSRSFKSANTHSIIVHVLIHCIYLLLAAIEIITHSYNHSCFRTKISFVSIPTVPENHKHPLNMESQRSARNPEFQNKISQMALRLSPLVRITTGDVHLAFPSTLLNFWLLTDEQCDSIANFYHQHAPSVYTRHYPCPIEWRTDASLEEKRRRIGRFIGLRGCESPVRVQSEDEITRETRNARNRAEEQEMFRRKMSWY